MRCREVEAGLRVGGADVPQAKGIVERTGEEGIVFRAEGEGGDGCGMTLEVAQELIVVRGEIADRVIFLGGGVED